MSKPTKTDELQQQVDELTADLQRTRADFENYRRRVDDEKTMARQTGRASAVAQLLDIIDDIERAISFAPQEISDNSWVKGVMSLQSRLNKSLENLGVSRIAAAPDTLFNPEFHEAVAFDEDADGTEEVIAEELRAGYLLDGVVLRPTMVNVTRK